MRMRMRRRGREKRRDEKKGSVYVYLSN